MSKATPSKQNKKRPHRLRSDARVKTAQYKKKLEAIYGKYITLASGVLYAGPSEPIDHTCLFCGQTSSAKPTTMLPNEKKVDDDGRISYKTKAHGRGCNVCRTESGHIHAYQQYVEELHRVHGKKFDFAYLPLRFVIDNGRYREVFKCNDCGTQIYDLARKLLDPKYKCAVCDAKKKLGTRTEFYKQRLEQLYRGKIKIVGKYHDSDLMHHTCDKHHSWLSSQLLMLMGDGCPRCKNRVQVKAWATEYRNQSIFVRSRLEAKALRVFSTKIGNYADIRTSLDFPIPVLYGKRSPALFDPKSGVMADVIKLEDFKKFVTKKKFEKSKERAAKLGFDYGVILVGKTHAAGLWTMNWLTGEDKIPEDWNFEDLQLGNGNVRTRIQET